MKALVTPAGDFGPYQNITVLADRYQCDDEQLPFGVVGQGEIVDASTVVFPPPPPAPVVVPAAVTKRQARQALRISGKLDLVQPAIDAIPDPLQRGLMQDEWDDSQVFERYRPSLLALAAAIGLSPQQIDDLFILAATR